MANFEFLSVAATGVQVTTGVTSATTAIPANSVGDVPKHVRVQAIQNCYIRPGGASTVCTVNDLLLSPNEAVVLSVAGYTHIAHLQEANGARFNITPLES